ncbi:SDR family NAD(P)-dependent oxidoreductase [Mycobacterium neumannii]|uniref:SDR family NAD(P)-dependent oxidoreductase n=1 Tax=Mycobacterium neumannii TaxID=2048551 RepID=UPI003AB4B422
MTKFDGKVAVVTGAGSGIGRALAIGLARRGALTAISDVDDEALRGTAARVCAVGREPPFSRLT